LVLISEKEESIQLIGFYAGGKFFGVDILSVREILRDPSIESVRSGPPFIEGRVRIRGEIIPVINLKERLGNSRSENNSDRNWLLIAHANDRSMAFLVDSVTRILTIAKESILPAPDLTRSGLRSQYIQGVCNSDFGMLVVIDLNRMLGADEIKALKKMVLE
jgi:purine-binding chemotaxis protein CheW